MKLHQGKNRNILIIHPEGNLNNNPNLSGIVEIMCEKGYSIDIFSLKRKLIAQKTLCQGSQIFIFDGIQDTNAGVCLLASKVFSSPRELAQHIRSVYKGYDIVIGVDRGIIEASIIANALEIPYGLISYEIFFADEAGSQFKQIEIQACQNLSFAICQDEIRSTQLSKENKILHERIIKIPVAGRGVKQGEKNWYFYDKFGIDRSKKIALVTGSIATWTMAYELVESVKHWDREWVLVLHNRYGLEEGIFNFYRQYNDKPNIYFSLDPAESIQDMHILLHCGDLGIALYKPNRQCIWTGNNLKYIGMASGKISTYLQHGLPLLINEIGEMSRYVEQYKLGISLREGDFINPGILENDIRVYKERCYDFFKNKLDLNITILPFLNKIDSLLRKEQSDFCPGKSYLFPTDNQTLFSSSWSYITKLPHIDFHSLIDSLNLQAKQALQNGDTQRAKELLTKVLNQSPNNIKALNNLAVTKILEKDWDFARNILQKVLKIDPSNKVALENTQYLEAQMSLQNSLLEAKKLIEQKEYSKAREILKNILEIDDRNIDALNDLAVVEISENNLFNAREILNKVLRNNSNNQVAKENMEYLEQLIHISKEKNSDIKVSAIVSTYNSERFIRGCLEDLTNQTLYKKGALEIIVIDSCSPQNERTIIEEFQKTHHNIVYVRTKKRETIYAAWNRAIKIAKGEYITNANTDDRHRKDALEVMSMYLDNNIEVALVYSDQVITQKENDTFEACIPIGYFQWPDFDRIQLIHTSCIGPQPMWRKSLHDDVGYFDETLVVAGDYEWWLRVSKKYMFKHIPELLGLYLLSSGGVEHANSKICQVETNTIRTRYVRDDNIVLDYKRYKPTFFTHIYRNSQRYIQQIPLMVSVIVPTYNRPAFLKVALESITVQTYKHIEVIVVNDAGEDVSDIIKSFRDRLSITYLVHTENKGLAVSRNTGINAAKGKYIAYLDDDDIFYEDHAETLVNFLENSDYKVAYTDAYRVHQEKENGEYVVKQKDIPYSFDFDPDLILAQNLFPVLCIMHEKTCTDEVGLFDESLTTHEDWDLWIRMSRKYKFAHIKRITCEFTWRTDSTTMSSEKRSDFMRTMSILYERYLEYSKDNQRILELQRAWLRHFQKVSIIIPVFNKIEFTRKCLEAIVKNTPKESYEVIIINNASTDDTRDFLKCLKGDVKIITNDKNLGFARACNQGTRMASTDYLLFLNNDTEPGKGWLEPLVHILAQDNSVGAVGSKLLFPDETIQYAGIVVFDDQKLPDPLVGRHIYYGESSNLPEANQLRTYQALTAACLLIRKSAFNEVGGFDEGYWNGYEDVDLCFKLQEKRWKLVYQPESVVIHHESKSGPERFIKVKENIQRLHDKWLGKIMPDIIIKEDGSTIVTENNKIHRYYMPNTPQTETPNIKPQKLVSIITLTWNAMEYTQKCIRSIQDHTHYPHEIIFVDNASTDGTVEYLRKIVKELPNYKLIENQENKGFAAGNNQGVKMASGEYIMLLNNDVLVSEGWLEGLVESLERDEKIGMVGPITNSISGRQMVAHIPYSDEGGFHEFSQKIRKLYRGRLTPRYRIAGFAVLMRKAFYEEVGGLDETFGTGNYEDDDLCLKVREKGYAIMVDESVYIHHYRSQTFIENKIDYKNSIIMNDSKFRQKWPGVNYEELLELHGSLTDTNAALVSQGQHTLESGNIHKAIGLFSNVLSTNPLDDSALCSLGLAYQANGEMDKAVNAYKKVIEIHSCSHRISQQGNSSCLLDAYYNLALIYANINQIDNAISLFEKVVTLQSRDASLYNNLGVLYYKKSMHNDANTCFEKALALDPNYEEAQQNLKKISKLNNYRI